MISLIKFIKERLINLIKCFENEEEVKNHIDIIQKENEISNRDDLIALSEAILPKSPKSITYSEELK